MSLDAIVNGPIVDEILYRGKFFKDLGGNVKCHSIRCRDGRKSYLYLFDHGINFTRPLVTVRLRNI